MISLWGERFTAEHQAESLPGIGELGLQAFQPEVFLPDRLDSWISHGGARVGEAADRAGLTASQLVGHFLLHGFDSEAALYSDWGIEEAGRFAETAALLPGCEVVTLPLPPFAPGPSPDPTALRARLREKLARVAAAVGESDVRVALELLPYSLLGGTGDLKAVLEELPERVGYNFDTGHAWACKERIELIPGRMGSRLLGTHLCDNQGNENRSDRPGTGTIHWTGVLAALEQSGYTGSLDLEIRCSPELVASEYRQGMQLLESHLQAAR
jgi:sugar phosphate isomerase/epimerase